MRYLLVITVICVSVLFACGTDNGQAPVAPSSADREKFIGNWAGTYECGNPPADTLIIAKGPGDLAFRITLHAQAFNAEPVEGELTDVNVIIIPEQTVGGFPGSGRITYADNVLALSQTGLGITCRGMNYRKF